MVETVSVVEIFESIQGETTYAGRPCAFVRLAGCNLRCSYCDTRYAVQEPGVSWSVEELGEQLHAMDRQLVCITGGEPLLQSSTATLASLMLEKGHKVIVETIGTRDISDLSDGVVKVMDVKCPASGECNETLPSNIERLGAADEVKFVLCDRGDFDWAKEFAGKYDLAERCKVLFAPAHGELEAVKLAEWILRSGIEARLQLQLHKLLWPHRRRKA